VVLGTLARVVRLASLGCCLVAVAWFVTFAVQQSSTAAAHQASEIYPSTPAATQSAPAAPAKEGELHETINSAFKTISSPFSSVTSGSTSAWKTHIIDTLLALLVYGVGLGFVARALRLAT
jgi:hypothetical protein